MTLPRAGQLLLATADIGDGIFAQSVVLMIRVEMGAVLGVILNRPLAISVADALRDAETASHQDAPIGADHSPPTTAPPTTAPPDDSPPDNSPHDAAPTGPRVGVSLFLGGPCPGPLTLLRHGGSTVEQFGYAPLGDGLLLTADRDRIDQVLGADHDDEGGPHTGTPHDASREHVPLRVFAGYAGWEYEQLKEEIASGVWRIVDASPQMVFSDPTTLWRRLTGRIVWSRWIDPDRIPENPSLN